MEERRETPRFPSRRTATVELPDGLCTLTVAIQDQSEAGCRLRSDEVWRLPERFKLRLGCDAPIPARAAWRDGRAMGVRLERAESSTADCSSCDDAPPAKRKPTASELLARLRRKRLAMERERRAWRQPPKPMFAAHLQPRRFGRSER